MHEGNLESTIRCYEFKLNRNKLLDFCPNFPSTSVYNSTYTLFFIRTSNFGAEAERSYFFFSI